MVSNELVRQAVDHVDAIEQLAHRHAQYAAMQSLDNLPSSQEIARELTDIVKEITDERYAQAASLITAAMSEGDGEFQNLDYLGHAIVLAANSTKGLTDEIGFQQTVRFLLAHNGYRPVKSNHACMAYNKNLGPDCIVTHYYDFFVNDKGTKVVAISSNGINVCTAELNSKFSLDSFVVDFENCRYGTTHFLNEIRPYQNIPSGKKAGLIMSIGFGTVMGGFAVIIAGSVGYTVGVAIPVLGIAAAVGYGIGFLLQKNWKADYQKKLQIAKQNIPFNYVSNGIYALLDAFPLEQNTVYAREAQAQLPAVQGAQESRLEQEAARAEDVVSVGAPR